MPDRDLPSYPPRDPGTRARRRRLMGALPALGATLALPAARAQPGFPTRPIRLVVAFGAGGIADTIARTMSTRLSERLGQPVIVDNRPGAGGTVGARIVTAAQADGHTLLVTTAAVAVNASAAPDAVDPVRGLTPLVAAASTPTIFAVAAAGTARTLADFVRGAKGGRFTFATAGVGTTEHLTGEFVFRQVSGVEAVHVPFSGGVAPVAAAVAQQVDMAVTTPPTAAGQVKAGTLRVLAVAARARMAQLPDVPTLREAGFADFENSSWIGVFGPPGLAPAVTARLNDELNAVIRLPEVRDRLVTLGFEPRGGVQGAFVQYVREEVAKWAKVIKATGIRPA